MRPRLNKQVILGGLGIFLTVLGVMFSMIWPVLFQHILRKPEHKIRTCLEQKDVKLYTTSTSAKTEDTNDDFGTLEHQSQRTKEEELTLSPKSKSFEIWRDMGDIPVSMEFYFFNWTNPEEITTVGVKPNLIEVGPYVFIEKSEKVNITFHEENSTVSYFQRKFWYFDEEKSKGSLQDQIVQLNVVALSAAHKIRDWSFFMQNSLSYLLRKISASIHVVKTVDELIFTGYEDPIIEMGKMAYTDDMPPYDRFGWFYGRNGSTEFQGYSNMGTGQDDINNLGVLKFWNYKDTTRYFKSPCNAIEGSTGEFYPPGRTKDDITLFSADMCRTMTYEYERTVTHQGITGYQYAIGEKTLGNSTKRRYPHEQAKYFEATTTTEDFFVGDHSGEVTDQPEEDADVVNMGQCFCNGECSPLGVVNITACRYGAPGFMSLPHFYKGDKMLRDQVIGMNPRAEDHSFYITLEPTTGIPLDVSARLQVNMLLQPSKSIELYKDVPRIYFPILWFNLKGGTTEELASSLKLLLLLPTMGFYSGVFVAIIGCLIVFGVLIFRLVQGKGGSSSYETSKGNSYSLPEKTEVIFVDRKNSNDDSHTRNNRQLYPKH